MKVHTLLCSALVGVGAIALIGCQNSNDNPNGYPSGNAAGMNSSGTSNVTNGTGASGDYRGTGTGNTGPVGSGAPTNDGPVGGH